MEINSTDFYLKIKNKDFFLIEFEKIEFKSFFYKINENKIIFKFTYSFEEEEYVFVLIFEDFSQKNFELLYKKISLLNKEEFKNYFVFLDFFYRNLVKAGLIEIF